MKRFVLTVPVDVGGDRTIYRRVDAMFENQGRDTGEIHYTIVLDFPVGATRLLAFPPREGEAAPGDGVDAQADASGSEAAA